MERWCWRVSPRHKVWAVGMPVRIFGYGFVCFMLDDSHGIWDALSGVEQGLIVVSALEWLV
jgi:hypothetical protein